MEQRSGPVRQIQVPLEQTQVPLEQSQEAQKQDSVQKQRKQLEKTIEQIVNLKTTNTPWDEIAEAVKLPKETCCHIWEDYSRQLAKAEAEPPAETSRRLKSWSNSEDKILLNLRKAGYKFNEIGAELQGRSESACRMRYERPWVNAHNPTIVKTSTGNEAREE